MISLSMAMVVGAACVLIEAFFSGSEIALVSADRSLLRRRASRGDRGAILAEKFLDKPEAFLATTLLGTNVATVTFSVTVSLALIGAGEVSGLWAIAIVTPMTLIFGEAVPKTLFQQHADRIVTKIVYPLRAAWWLLRPGVWLLSSFASAVTGILGVDRERSAVTRAELSLLIEAEDNGRSQIPEHQRAMISNVFDRSRATAEDVMVPLSKVAALPDTLTVREAVLRAAREQHSRMPVYRSRVDNIVGILDVFDLLRASMANENQTIASIAKPAQFVPWTQPGSDLLIEIGRSGAPMVVVVNEYGGAIGVLTMEDLVEEIVGEIDDEFDADTAPIRSTGPGVWRVPAHISVERLNRQLDLNLPEGDNYESMAGLILRHLKHVPEPGVSLALGDVDVVVVAASNRSIDTVQLCARG